MEVVTPKKDARRRGIQERETSKGRLALFIDPSHVKGWGKKRFYHHATSEIKPQ